MESVQYGIKATKVGLTKIKNASLFGDSVKIQKWAVGDGGGAPYTPSESQTELKNKVDDGIINSSSPNSETTANVEFVIPHDRGPYFVREIGLYDTDGDLIYIAATPEQEKVNSDFTVTDMHFELMIDFFNSDAVKFIVDPNKAIASHEHVSIELEKAKEELLQVGASLYSNASSGANIPAGTTHIELNDELFQLSKVASGVLSNIKYNDEGNPYSAEFAAATVALIQARIPNIVAIGKAFGIVANGAADDTEMFWNALDWLKERGGGRLVLDGDIKVSLANSRHDKVCVIIPANVELYSNSGASISRLDSERGQDGVLLCNEGYDDPANGGKYSAAGNIIIDGLKISDGALFPTRGLGDLIGFGNGDGLVVQNCDFGNHDQHAVDVAKSRNFVIRYNKSSNAVDAAASATYQVDAGLIWGIAGGPTSSYDGYIYENDINESLAENVIHFHSGNQAKNVHIFKNRIKPNSKKRTQNAIGGDTDCGYINCFIFDNEITMNSILSRCINLPTQDNTNIVRGLKIFNNTLEGKFRVGIFAGDDNPSRSDTNGPLISIKVFDNNIKCDLSEPLAGGFIDARMIAVSAFKKARVFSNDIDITKGSANNKIYFIDDRNVENFFCYDNDLSSDNTTTSGVVVCISSAFDLHKDNDLRTIKTIKDNFINVFGANYFIEMVDPGSIGNYVKLQGVIGGNRMPQQPKAGGAHIKEVTPLSDGTNNLGYVNFIGYGALADDPFVLPITKASSYLNLPLPGKKQAANSNKKASANKVEILYSPNDPNFGSDTETINTAYLSPTTCVGVLVKDVSLPDGNFDIITGNKGVSMVINDTSFEPVIREGGWIKILAGI